MYTHAIRRNSLWTATATVPQPGPLSADIQVDVCVVGAGIAGLTTAYLLGREGKQVAVIDAGPVAGGNTQYSTAHLTAVLERRYADLERLHGPKRVRAAAASHAAAIDCIEGIARFERIHCDFTRVDGYLFGAADDSDDVLDDELEAAIRAGLWGVEKVAQAPWDAFATGPALRFPGQAQFHPLRYVAGLVRAIQRDGGRIFTETRATAIEGGYPAHVYTGAGPVVTADQVVVATNTPIDDRFVMHSKQAPYLSYVIGALVPRGSVPRALFWDTEEPYHYVRVQPLSPSHVWQGDEAPGTHEVLLIGGEDHKTGQVDDQGDRYDRLETWARERFPLIDAVRFRWTGQVMESMDGLGFIGTNPLDSPNVFIATGDSGNGMTQGTLAGMILTDLIAGRDNDWAKLYDPSRRTFKAARTFVRENLNVLQQYRTWFTPGDIASVKDLAPDTGAVIRSGISKLAVYRDARGNLHQRSAVCPHLGAIVRWNQADRTFDCPCYGSRFDCYGRVINGPASRDLARVWELEAGLRRPEPMFSGTGLTTDTSW
jgi:glycine/D-amino acid oxidase-like deaminating enzyme/nitrite reductase/ring-hydroxylating ferredoxin subunit